MDKAHVNMSLQREWARKFCVIIKKPLSPLPPAHLFEVTLSLLQPTM